MKKKNGCFIFYYGRGTLREANKQFIEIYNEHLLLKNKNKCAVRTFYV